MRGLTLVLLIVGLALIIASLHYFNEFLLACSSCSDGRYYIRNFAISIDFFFLEASVDLFGLVLVFLAYLVGFFSLCSLDTRYEGGDYRLYLYFNILIVAVYIYVLASNLFLFFLAYEMLLLPAFFFVYYMSVSKNATQAALYFLM